MTMTQQPNLTTVDWSKIPAPVDNGGAAHLMGHTLPWVGLRATDDTLVMLQTLPGRVVVFIYPMTGQPGVNLPDGWDDIPGARGCTPQSCAFRDLYGDLTAAGAARVYGLSTQDTDYQREAVARLHLPFPLLSDADLMFATALRLPTLEVNGQTLLERMALVIDAGTISQVFYPVFPPDRNAGDVLAWLQANPRTSV
jgi:peroxiredoxin